MWFGATMERQDDWICAIYSVMFFIRTPKIADREKAKPSAKAIPGRALEPCFRLIKTFGWLEKCSHAGKDMKKVKLRKWKDIEVEGFETKRWERCVAEMEVTFHHCTDRVGGLIETAESHVDTLLKWADGVSHIWVCLCIYRQIVPDYMFPNANQMCSPLWYESLSVALITSQVELMNMKTVWKVAPMLWSDYYHIIRVPYSSGLQIFITHL